MNSSTDGWMNGRVDESMDEQTAEWPDPIEGRVYVHKELMTIICTKHHNTFTKKKVTPYCVAIMRKGSRDKLDARLHVRVDGGMNGHTVR